MSSQTGPAAAAHEASTSTARRVVVQAPQPQHAAGPDARPLHRLQTTLGNQAMARLFGPIPAPTLSPTSTLPPTSASIPPASPPPGRPLESAARDDMETRFGTDLSSVRVRTDPTACDAVGALAYTVGEEIVFNAGAYAPHAQAGRTLLAHELTHVLQQRLGAGASSQGRLEGEAKRVSRALASGTGPVTVRERGHVALARQEKPEITLMPDAVFTRRDDGSLDFVVDGETVLRNVQPANNAVPYLKTVTGPKLLDLHVMRQSTADAIIDWDGVKALELHGYQVSALIFTQNMQVGEQIKPTTFSYQTPRKPLNLTLDPPSRPHPAPKPPAQKPPAQKPPAQKPPAQKPPAQKPPAQKPPAQKPPAQKPPAPKPTASNPPALGPPASNPPASNPPVADPGPTQSQAPATLQPSTVSPTPGIPSTPAIPAAAPDLDARADRVRRNLGRFTFNISWRQDIASAFKDLNPADFQSLQDRLGEDDMEDAFDQLTPFMATLIGSYGTVTKGKETLNDKRVEFIEDVKDWGSVRATFYQWMLESMSIDDITLVLRQLGADKRMRDTILTVPGLQESLIGRGVDPTAFDQEDTTAWEGFKRAMGGLWSRAWSGTAAADGPAWEYTYLPKDYQENYFSNLNSDFITALKPANVVRGVASNVTLGLSEVPVGIYAAGEATVQASIDLWNGKTGDATEKFTPVVVMILAALAGRAIGKAAAAEDSKLLATTRPQPGVPTLPNATAVPNVPALPGAAPSIRFEVRSLGKTAAGLDRYLVRDVSGEVAEMIVDPQQRTIRATHLGTGDVVTYENGQVSRGPAGLLPPASNAAPTPGATPTPAPSAIPGPILGPGPGMPRLGPGPGPILGPGTAPGPILGPGAAPAPILGPILGPGPGAPRLGPGPGATLGVSRPVLEATAPADALAKADPVPLASGSVKPVSAPLPSTPRTAAADLRVTQARDALAAANKATSAQRERVLAAQRDLDAAVALKNEAGRRSASGRDLVKEHQAILSRENAGLRPLSASQELATADYAKALEDQKQIVALESEVARLNSEVNRELNPPGGFSPEAQQAGRRPWIKPNYTQPGGPEYYLKASQLNAARTKLAERVQDLNVTVRDRLAAATPGPAARPVALASARSLPNEALHPVNGVPIDVTTGRPMTTADWATDHLESRVEIAKDPRFARLSPAKQREILTNVPENYLPITPEANSSKGFKSVDDWIAARAKTNPIPENMARALRAADERARAAIERFFQENEGK